MIPDYEKNHVAFTERLRDEKKYGEVAADLEQAFKDHPVKVEVLSHCRDIWCRDFMPIQVAAWEFVQFVYAPSYLRPSKEHKTITVPGLAYPKWLREEMDVLAVPIVLDGGSVVGNHEKALVSERAFSDNPAWSSSELSKALRELLQVSEIVWIPEHPDDITGHVDGTVRLISNRIAVVASPADGASDEVKHHAAEVRARVERAGFSILSIPDVSHRNSRPLDVAGCFANFVQVGGLVVMPSFEKYEKEGEVAAAQLRDWAFNVIGTKCSKVAREGGAINCVTWNYLRVRAENEAQIEPTLIEANASLAAHEPTGVISVKISEFMRHVSERQAGTCVYEDGLHFILARVEEVSVDLNGVGLTLVAQEVLAGRELEDDQSKFGVGVSWNGFQMYQQRWDFGRPSVYFDDVLIEQLIAVSRRMPDATPGARYDALRDVVSRCDSRVSQWRSDRAP